VVRTLRRWTLHSGSRSGIALIRVEKHSQIFIPSRQLAKKD
jgi:hypothetical protein